MKLPIWFMKVFFEWQGTNGAKGTCRNSNYMKFGQQKSDDRSNKKERQSNKSYAAFLIDLKCDQHFILSNQLSR